MRAGQLREVIRLQRNTGGTTASDSLDPEYTWETYRTLRAEVESSEIITDRVVGNQLAPGATVTFVIRYCEIESSDRIVWQGRAYQIGTLDHDLRDRSLRIYASYVEAE